MMNSETNIMDLEIDVPSYFICPISMQMMTDPVTVSTGITYDRESIETWVFANNTTCPVTKQVLTDIDFLTPNHTLRRLIQSWCTLNASCGVERFPTPRPPASKPQIVKLLNEATRFPQSRPKCLERLKSMASRSTTNRRCLESAGAVAFLLSRVVLEDEIDKSLDILSHLQISEERLQNALLKEEGSVLALMDTLAHNMSQGSYESRVSAIEIMKSAMQVAEPAQAAALRREHFVEVVRILRDQVSPQASKSALKVLTLACPWGKNRVRAVKGGAVPALVDLLLETACSEGKWLTEMALAVLDQLCGCAEGRAELLAHAAGLAVVSKTILRVSHFATERGVRILSSISRFSGSPAVLQEMVQFGVVTKLCLVLQMDCEVKTKERAREILKLHARAWRNSPCAPDVLHSLSC